MYKSILGLMFIATNAFAANPLEIRGVALGDTMNELRAQHSDASCEASESDSAATYCFIRGYGSAEDAFVMYIVVDGAVESVRVRMDANRFSGIVLAMREKFGDATEELLTVKNAMGAEFQSRTFTWLTLDQRLVAIERDGQINKSSIALQSMKGIRASTERFKAAKSSEAKSL